MKDKALRADVTALEKEYRSAAARVVAHETMIARMQQHIDRLERLIHITVGPDPKIVARLMGENS